MYEQINGNLFITEDNVLIIKPNPVLVCERIWNADQIERQNKIDEEKLKALPNLIKLNDIQDIFDKREREYNLRLIEDGEKLAKQWLSNQKQYQSKY